MSSIGTGPGLFEWGLLPPALFDMGTLDVAGNRFDVSGAALLRGGDSVHVVSRQRTRAMETGFPWQRQRAHGQVASGVVVGCIA